MAAQRVWSSGENCRIAFEANTIVSRELAKVISNNLNGTGLFKTITQTAYIETPISFNSPVKFNLSRLEKFPPPISFNP